MRNGGARVLGRALVSLVTMGLLLIASPLASPAGAQSYDSMEECLDARPMDVSIMAWSCSGTDGAWTSMYSSGGGVPSVFGTFMVIAVFWSLIPLAIAAFIASDRGESIGMAIGLTAVLGWIGLAIVYFGQANTHQAASGLANRAVSPPPKPPATPVEPRAADPSVPERLRRLDELHRDEMLSDSEYAEQRRRILDSL